MSRIILHSTGCPLCKRLKKELDAANIQYELNTDEEIINQLNLEYLPVLEVNGKKLEFSDARNWIKETTNGN